MALRKKSTLPHRRVWRMSSAAPFGEIVDPAAPNAAPDPPPRKLAPAPENPEPGWQVSSHDLLRGLEVSEASDTLPGELFDELFKR